MRMASLLLRSGWRGRDELGTALEAEAERVWELLSGRPFDAEIEAGWDDAPLAELVGVLEGLAGRLGDRLDATDSYAQVGTVYPSRRGRPTS